MVCAALAREAGFEVLALTIDYNQRHRVELEAAESDRRAACRPAHRPAARPDRVRRLGADRRHGRARRTASGEGIPVTYVPARNTIFLSLALAWAEAAGARDLFIGVNALDYSGYPDCRPEFIAAFEALANRATKAGVEGEGFTVHAPLQHMTKADIAREAAAARARRGAQPQLLRPGAGRQPLRPVRRLPAARQGVRRGGAARPDRSTHDLRGQGGVPDAAGRGRAGGQPGGVPALRRLQSVVGARSRTGRPRSAISATPISSAPTGRAAASSPTRRSLPAMSRRCGASGEERRLVVVTGGEPMLQLDAALVDALHERGFRVAVESNGTLAAVPGIDWLCVSPKAGTDVVQRSGDELKLVWPQPGIDPAELEDWDFRHFLVQPMDCDERAGGDRRGDRAGDGAAAMAAVAAGAQGRRAALAAKRSQKEAAGHEPAASRTNSGASRRKAPANYIALVVFAALSAALSRRRSWSCSRPSPCWRPIGRRVDRGRVVGDDVLGGEILVNVHGVVGGFVAAASRNRQGRTGDQDKSTHSKLPRLSDLERLPRFANRAHNSLKRWPPSSTLSRLGQVIEKRRKIAFQSIIDARSSAFRGRARRGWSRHIRRCRTARFRRNATGPARR